MDEPLLWLGTVACALAAAAGLLARAPRVRTAGLAAALLSAPVLVAADNWNSDRIGQLRDSPALTAALAVGAALVLGALVVVFLRRSHLIPVIAVAALPFRIPVDLGSSTANLLLPLYAVIVAALIATAMRGWNETTEQRGLLRFVTPALALLIGVYALQSAYSSDPSTATDNVAFFFAPFAVLFRLLADARWDRRLLRTVALVVVAEAVVVALVGFGQYAVGELLWNDKVIAGNEAHSWFRVNSLFWDPNIMGRYLAVTMVVLAGAVGWARSTRDALTAGAVFLLLLAALMITFSQSSLLALLAGLAVLAAARWGPLPAAIGALLAVAAIAASVTAIAGGGLTAETSGRGGLISGGLELAADRPLQGYGSGSFGEEYKNRFGGGPGIAVESHTEPVTVAAEQGLVGAVPYALLLAVSLGGLVEGLRRASGTGHDDPAAPLSAALLAAYAAMVVHSLGYAAFLTDPITWALLAIAIAAVPARAPVGEAAPTTAGAATA